MAQRLQTCLGPCGRELPLDEFWVNRYSPNGHVKRCKDCINTKRRGPNAIPRGVRRAGGMRNCSQCHDLLPEHIFIERGQGRRGQSWICPDCLPRYTKNMWYRREYGITYDQFEALWIGQEEQCAVCNRDTDTPSLDHCHATGHIRGILCPECNKAAGLLQDNVERIEALARYIGGDGP